MIYKFDLETTQTQNSDINESIKQKIKESFTKIAKAEGLTKVKGPYNQEKSTFDLETQATAGNQTDKKKKLFPLIEHNDQKENPNIDWHLTSKAKSIDYKNDSSIIQNDDWTNFESLNLHNSNLSTWGNFTKFGDQNQTFTKYKEDKPMLKNNITEFNTLHSDVKVYSDANTGKTKNINTISIESKDGKPKPFKINNKDIKKIEKFEILDKNKPKPVQNKSDVIDLNKDKNTTSDGSQKSLIRDGDTIRTLKIINETLIQNTSITTNKLDFLNKFDPNKNLKYEDCKCGSTDYGKTCIKCDIKGNSPSIYESSKEKVPFKGEIKMSNKHYNIEGTVYETGNIESKTGNGNSQISSSNNNVIGMSLLKNNGYDPKEKSHKSDTEITESSVNLKLSPSIISDKKKNLTNSRFKKGKIEIAKTVEDIGDINDESQISIENTKIFNSNNKNETMNNLMDKLQEIISSSIQNIPKNNSQNINKTDNNTKIQINNYNLNEENITNNTAQKKDLVNIDDVLIQNENSKDSFHHSSTALNPLATIIATVLAGLVIIGMIIVAIVAVISRNMNTFELSNKNNDEHKSKRTRYRSHGSPRGSPRNNRIKEKILFNA